MGHQESAVYVYVNDLEPFIVAEFHDRLMLADTGVVKKNIELPEGFDKVGNSIFHLVRI